MHIQSQMYSLWCAWLAASIVLSSVASANDGFELVDAALFNSAAFQNYDVTIEEWKTITEDTKRNTTGKQYEELESTIKRHVVIDYETERYFEVCRTVWSRNPSPPDARVSEKVPAVQLGYFCHCDKKSVEAPLGNPVKRPVELSYWQFLALSRVPNVPLSVLGVYPAFHTKEGNNVILSERLSELLHKNMAEPKPIVRTLPDGTRVVRWATDKASMTLTFDPRYIPPVKEVRMYEMDKPDKKRVIEVERKLEEIKGVFRLTGITTSQDSVEFVSAYSEERVPVVHMETVQFHWHQFNEDSFNFPDVAELMKSPKSLNEFLDHSEK